MGALAVAALAIDRPNLTSAHTHHGVLSPLVAPGSGNHPAVVVHAYVAAVNDGDLDAILALYDDNAFHIALPSPDGSAGVCVGKDQFRMWYEQSLANGDRVEIEPGTLTVVENQATFGVRLSSEPWRKLGVETLAAHAEIVVVKGRIMTHVVMLTPASVRMLQSASGMAILAPLAGHEWASTQLFPGRPY
jgi:hypothetical protein